MATYVKPVVCENCGATVPAYIPKGQTVDDFMRETNCPVCGCKMKRAEVIPSSPSYPWPYPYYYWPYWYPTYVYPTVTYTIPYTITTNAPVDTWSGYSDLPSTALGIVNG
jgi:hypothetical protein